MKLLTDHVAEYVNGMH